MTSNYTQPHTLMDNMNSEELKEYFEGLEKNFTELGKLSERLKKDIDSVLSGMDEFQVFLCIKSINL